MFMHPTHLDSEGDDYLESAGPDAKYYSND